MLYIHQNIFKVILVVLLITTTGVHRRTMQKTHGNRISTIVIRTTTIRTTTNGFVLSGVLNKPVLCPDKLLFGQSVFLCN